MIRERLSSAIMESLLALTIFREEFGTFFVAMFASLVFIKVMHWLVQDRVDYVEVTPSVSLLQHVRLVSFMSTLLVGNVSLFGCPCILMLIHYDAACGFFVSPIHNPRNNRVKWPVCYAPFCL